MASTEKDYAIASLRKQILRERQQGNTRSIWTRGRTLESSTHGAQIIIPVDPNYDMRDPATGSLWFVDGYSAVSDTGTEGDPVRPV